GTEEGLTEIVRAAEECINELAGLPEFMSMPMTILTKAFCRFFFGDAREALAQLKNVQELSTGHANWAQLALINSGMGISNHFLGRLVDAHASYSAALELLKKVGDDARVSTVAANLC